MRRFNSILVAAVVTVTALPSIAGASGFLVARFGGEQGHPTTNHPSAIYFNPAGLALGSGTRIYAEGLVGVRKASYVRPDGAIDNVVPEGQTSGGTPSSAVSANSGRAELSNPFAAPFVAIVSDLGVRNLGVGAAVYVPFGGAASWGQNSDYADNGTYPGAVDGVQRWWSIEGKIQSLYTTVAASYYIPAARLAFGAGVNLIRTEVNTIRARNASGTDDLVASNGTIQEGRALLDASNMTLSLGVGAIWQPTTQLSIGVSYQSRPNFGTTNLKGELQTKLGQSEPSMSEVQLRWPLPDVVRAGLSYRPANNVELRVFGDFVRWSVVDNHCAMTMDTADKGCVLDDRGNPDPNGATISFNIPRHWKDTFGARAGGSYWWAPGREVFAGVGYDGSAIPDETMGPDIIDQPKMTASLGARVQLGQRLRVAGTFTQVFYFERTVDVSEMDAFDGLSRTPDQGGSYRQAVSVFNLGLELAF